MKILHRLRGEMETPRLLLRRWKPLDFQAFLRFAGDPEVMLPAGSKPAQGLQEAETQFHRALRDEGVKRVYTGHCTGPAAAQLLERELGGGLVLLTTGMTFTV